MGKTKRPVGQPVLAQVGENIRRIRGTATQASIAEAAGISQSMLSRIEKGDYPSLDLDTVVKLALAFDTGIYDLLFGLDMAMQIVGYEREAA